MGFFLIVLTSLISALIFDVLPIWKNSKSIFILQKKSLQVIKNPELCDNQKQNILLSYSRKILFLTIKLVCFFAIMSMPLVGLISIGHWFSNNTNFLEIIFSIKGICLSFVTFLLYYSIKKIDGKFRV